MHNAQQRHTHERIEKLKSLKTNNPKMYWKVINPKVKASETNESLDDFFDFFQELNSDDLENGNDCPVFVENNDILNEEINSKITEAEIRKAIKTLKNNKAPGIDNIINEQIASSSNTMISLY